MNFGTQTPVEVAVMGPDFAATRAFAGKVREELAKVPSLRDLQYGQALEYPAIQVNVNRRMAGQLGVTVDDVGRSYAAATSSSPALIAAASSAGMIACAPSIATCALEARMSCCHNRLSNGMLAFISCMIAAGPSANRPPHI